MQVGKKAILSPVEQEASGSLLSEQQLVSRRTLESR